MWIEMKMQLECELKGRFMNLYMEFDFECIWKRMLWFNENKVGHLNYETWLHGHDLQNGNDLKKEMA